MSGNSRLLSGNDKEHKRLGKICKIFREHQRVQKEAKSA
jgi:hypothetical protein